MGTVSKRLLELPGRLPVWEYASVAFIGFGLAFYWGRFVNRLV